VKERGRESAAAAFDAIADGYDADFSQTELGLLLRARLWSVLEGALPRRGQLLELGCGTGNDAVHFAQRGAAVLATDQSDEMLTQTSAKAQLMGVDVQTARLDLAQPSLPPDAGPFDGAWSSFGPLNCITNRAPLWAFLAQHVRPGGVVVLVVMAPLTPWDWLWFGGHGQLGAASRRLRAGRLRAGRLRAGRLANAGAGSSVRVWYPSWRTLVREAGPAFELRRAEGIGALLPISEAGHLVTRFPRFFGFLARIESYAGRIPPAADLCDHYALVLRRTTATQRP